MTSEGQDQIVGLMKEQLEGLQKEEFRLQDELAQVKARAKGLEQGIRAITGERMASTRSSSGSTLLDKVRDLVTETEGEFTSSEVAESLVAKHPELTTKQSQVSSILAQLRREGKVDVTGKRPNPGGGRPLFVYSAVEQEQEQEEDGE